ncbi:MAG: Hsp20/alpha crystallin family protein [Chloroflexota bacterium]
MHENRKQVLGEFDQMLKEFDRFFDNLSSGGRMIASHYRAWSPPTDVYATDTCVVVKIEIGGMRKEDFEIVFDQGVLTVSGARNDPSNKQAYQRLEIAYGEFMTQVHVPWAVAEDHIEAEYNLGFLSVLLPKRPLEHTRIPVTFIEDPN